MLKKEWCYVKSFWYNTGVWQTDRLTDGHNSYINISRQSYNYDLFFVMPMRSIACSGGIMFSSGFFFVPYRFVVNNHVINSYFHISFLLQNLKKLGALIFMTPQRILIVDCVIFIQTWDALMCIFYTPIRYCVAAGCSRTGWVVTVVCAGWSRG